MLLSSPSPPSSSPPPPPPSIPIKARKKSRQTRHQQPSLIGTLFGEDELPEPLSRYAVGAILRVCVRSFLTFDSCTVTPGPWMNMIMGPNGSGKSSLVAAIALGLGASPTVLGRSKNIEEYIQYGQPFASIEIVLKNDNQPIGEGWTVIQRLIVRKSDGIDHGSEWRVNGKLVTTRFVKELVQSLNINLDNLCQFLPQDKVSEFARLSPSELLKETEKVAAPPAALQMHLKLCELKQDESRLSIEQDTDIRLISNRQEASDNIENIFVAMKAQQEHLRTADLCKKKILLLQYNQAKADHDLAKQDWEATKHELQEADASAEPLRLKIDHLNQQIKATTFIDLDKKQKQVLQQQEKLTSLAAKQTDAKRLIEKSRILIDKKTKDQQELCRLMHRLQSELTHHDHPLVFNPDFMKNELRQSLLQQDSISRELIEMDTTVNQMRRQGESITNEINEARRQLNKLADERERRIEYLNRVTPDTIKALDWLNTHTNRSMFKGAVFGPIALELHIKKSAPAGAGKVIEGLLSRNVLNAFVFSDIGDQKLFMKKTEQWRVGSILVDLSTNSSVSASFDPQSLGFDCMAIDCVEGPDAVLRAVCEQNGLDQTPIALTKDVADHNKLVHLKRYVSMNSLYTIKVSRYSADDRLVRCTHLRPPVFFTTELAGDDQERAADLHTLINNHNQTLLKNAESIKPMLARQQDLQSKLEASREDYQKITELRRSKQAEFEEYNVKSKALAMRQSEYNELKTVIDAERNNETTALIEYDGILAERLKLALQCSSLLSDYFHAYDEQVLKQGLQTVVDVDKIRQLQGEYQRLLDANQTLRSVLQEKDVVVKNLHKTCKQLFQCLSEQGITSTLDTQQQQQQEDEYSALPDTIRELVEREQVERVRAENMERECGGIDFTRLQQEQLERQKELQVLRERVTLRKDQITQTKSSLKALKEQWLDMMKPLVQAINEAFGALFASMNSVGQVDLEAGALGEDDFNGYELVIRVKFRAEEHLQRLTATRQSGGEKSVTTILYLLSLSQVMASGKHPNHHHPPPFKVVDEINQGMDVINERRMHKLVVETSIHSGSQYFLITPKLLTDLEYCDKMHVLCVY